MALRTRILEPTSACGVLLVSSHTTSPNVLMRVCVCVCGVLRYGTQLSVPGASVPIDSAQPTDVFSRTAPLPMKGEELTAFFHEVVGDFTTRWHAGDLNGSVPRSRSEGIGMWLSCSVFKLLSVLVQFPAQASQFLSKVCCEAAHGMRWQCQCRA